MLSTEASSGGAARAMQRLAKGLRARGHGVDGLVAIPGNDVAHEIAIVPSEHNAAALRLSDAINAALDADYVAARRTDVSNTFFSTQVRGFDLSALAFLKSYDVINVHWTGTMMSPLVLGRIIDLGIPVVFTLHDMGHFTGGCHYSAGCSGFTAQCHPCDQVRPDELNLISASLDAKRASYGKKNVRAVSPSTWLAGEADRSRVFPAPVHVIPNAIETDVFHAGDREAARRALGLKDETRAILFGVYDDAEARKGYRRLIEALKRAREIPAFAQRASDDSIRFLAFGKSGHDLNEIGIPSIALGWIADDLRLSEIYRATDLCVLPSSEDNQPNVMLEAMACGVPVVAFRIGGIPETIVDGVSGHLVEPFDVDAMAGAMTRLVVDPGHARQLGDVAASAARAYSLDRQAKAYEQVFEDLVQGSAWTSTEPDDNVFARDDAGRRFAKADLVLNPDIEEAEMVALLAEQIASLKQSLEEVTRNRDEIHRQLVGVQDDYVAVRDNRDGLRDQLTALSEHSAASDSDLKLLKRLPPNRWLLSLRNKMRAR